MERHRRQSVLRICRGRDSFGLKTPVGRKINRLSGDRVADSGNIQERLTIKGRIIILIRIFSFPNHH